jgi:CRP/FNR family transcriptional regulator
MHDSLAVRAPVFPTTMPSSICTGCEVRQTSLCGSLDDSGLSALYRVGRRRHVESGETLAWAGEESRCYANILSGMFKLSALTIDGREQIVGLLHPADFVGRPFVARVEFSVTALSKAEICVFPRDAFENALADHGPLEHELLRRTLATLDDARRRMLLLGRQSAAERVAGFLLEMHGRFAECRGSILGPATFDLPLTRGAIADVLGLTIETVSRQMTKLRIAGVIALPGGRAVTILQQQALERLSATA